MAGILSKEKFADMIKQLDKDGDGTVTKEEFREVYSKSFDVSAEEYNLLWAKIDADGDGNLTAEELAKYYGFSWSDVNGHATEMTDDQILETLKIQDTLAKEGGAPISSDAAEPTRVARDPTIVVVRSMQKPDKDKEAEAAFLSACHIYDKQVVREAIEKKAVNVRIEEGSTGEMPLHKLAKAGAVRAESTAGGTEADKAREAEYDAHKQLFLGLLEMAKKQAGDKFKSDLNHPDAVFGKTPLMFAVEFNRRKLIMPLIKEGADPMRVNREGWNIMHSAVNADNKELLDELLSVISPARVKALVDQKDKQGRTPLMIAAFRCSEDAGILELLMKLGSDTKVQDRSGNTAGKLAEKVGRRRSRDLIEAYTQAS